MLKPSLTRPQMQLLNPQKSLAPRIVTIVTGTIAATGATGTVIDMVVEIVIGTENDEIEAGTKVEGKEMVMVMRE